jgi:DNA polymerase-4
VKLLFYVLADSVATRLRSNQAGGRTVQIHVKDSAFQTKEYQMRLRKPTQSASEILFSSMHLFSKHYTWKNPVRTLGIRVSDLEDAIPRQLSMFDAEEPAKIRKLEFAVDEIRRRFGYFSIERALLVQHKNLSALPVRSEYAIGTRIFKR